MNRQRQIAMLVLVFVMLLLGACLSPAKTVVHKNETVLPPDAPVTIPVSIPAIRQGKFKIRVVDENGTAVPKADLTIHQTRHEFIFGGQVPFWLIDPAYADQGDQTAVLQRAAAMFE